MSPFKHSFTFQHIQNDKLILSISNGNTQKERFQMGHKINGPLTLLFWYDHSRMTILKIVMWHFWNDEFEIDQC